MTGFHTSTTQGEFSKITQAYESKGRVLTGKIQCGVCMTVLKG